MDFNELYGIFPEIKDYREVLDGLLDRKRLCHSVNTMLTAFDLAKHLSCDEDDVRRSVIAGLLHDIAKCRSEEEMREGCIEYGVRREHFAVFKKDLMHGPLGAEILLKDFRIYDEIILDAVRYHTTGRERMHTVEKVVFLADYIEPGRNFDGVEKVRKAAYKSVDEALFEAMSRGIMHVVKKEGYLHMYTVKARNYYNPVYLNADRQEPFSACQEEFGEKPS